MLQNHSCGKGYVDEPLNPDYSKPYSVTFCTYSPEGAPFAISYQIIVYLSFAGEDRGGNADTREVMVEGQIFF
ncbi:MAG: hypothetical protein JOZ41_13095 [Chloroflexi bacterium]|nr:hypothetical protein [Chloroflexota bacterium]